MRQPFPRFRDNGAMVGGKNEVGVDTIIAGLLAVLAALFREWMPHRRCVGDDPLLLGLQLSGDFMTWVAYLLIPFALVSFIRRNHMGVMLLSGARAVSLYWWFAAFILLCGTTHLMSMITVWKGYYMVDAIVRIATGIVSLITVDRLWRTNLEQRALWSSADHLSRVRHAVQMTEEALATMQQIVQQQVATTE